MPDMKLKPVAQQVVVVMGASSGIGRATAARFAREGAKVVVAARGEPGLRSLVEEIRTDGGEAVAEVADVTDPDQMQRVAQRAVTEYGRLDTWVHVSGVLLVAPFERTTPEEFARVVDVNLMGQVHGAMAALPYLKRDGKHSSTSRRWAPNAAWSCRAPTAPPSTVSTASSTCSGRRCAARSCRSASRTSCRRRST